ncbi:hypothetical protein [Roseicella aerolata]|nr:hypothetical protein [Roseicella aerolata]
MAMISLALRTLFVLAVLLAVLAVTGLAQPPHLPTLITDLSR